MRKYRVRANPAGKKALGHSTNVVIYAVSTLVMTWGATPKDDKLAILATLGMDQGQLAIVTLITTLVGIFLAKNTSIQRVDQPGQADDAEFEDSATDGHRL